MKKILSRLTISFFVVLAVLFMFQNCGRKDGGSHEETSPSLQGGGGGYDGKTFVNLADAVCSDKSLVKTRAVVVNGAVQIVRENCQNLSAPRVAADAQVSGQTVGLAGQTLDLESVPPTLDGEITFSDLGDFAPAVNLSALGETTFIRGAPLNERLILVVAVNGLSPMTTAKAILYQRDGMALTELGRSAVKNVDGLVGYGDEDTLNPIIQLIPFGESRALLLVRKPGNSFGFIPLTRNGNIFEIGELSSGVNASRAAAQSLDSSRALLWYRRSTDQAHAFRIVSFGDGGLALGAELSTGASDPVTPTFLPGEAPGKTRVYARSSGKLATFTITASGTALTYNNDFSELADFGADVTEPVATGAGGDGFVLYANRESASIFQVGDFVYRWARVISGVLQPAGLITGLTSLGFGPGVELNSAGAANLHVAGRDYLTTKDTLGGGRLFFLEPAASKPKRYTLAVPPISISQESRDFFSSGDKLIVIGVSNPSSEGFISILSTPK